MPGEEIVVVWEPFISKFPYKDKNEGVIPCPTISDSEIVDMCIEHFNQNFLGSKHPLLGYHYTEEKNPVNIWINDFNHLCHTIEEIWKEGDKYLAKIKFFDYVNIPTEELPKKYVGLICHSEFSTRLLKINSIC